jgi:hypothetical protein
MKKFLSIIFAATVALVTLVCAGTFDLEIHCAPKSTDALRPAATAGHVQITKEHWTYDVTIENKTFKDMSGLEMKYIIFLKQEKIGQQDAASMQRHNGSTPIALLRAHEKKTFNTDVIELNKKILDSGWFYPDGTRRKADDALIGLWVRVYQNGQQIGEYANPSTLMTQQKWD